MQKNIYISLIALALGLVIIISLGLGAFKISLPEFLNALNPFNSDIGTDTKRISSVLWQIRFPRIVLALLIGSSLAVSGVGLQGVFRNPLADPALIGIAAGALLFTSISIVFGGNFLGYYGLSLISFVGACLAATVVMLFSRINGTVNVSNMLLVGIAINALASALTGFIIYLADSDELKDITFWTLGSLGAASWKAVFSIAPFCLITLFAIPSMSKSLNAYSLGDNEAHCLGINPNRLKWKVIILSTLSVGASVAVAGMIGFVGLIVPHLARLLFGANHKMVIVTSALIGAILVIVSDSFSRTVVAPSELPIGIVIALLSTPVLLSLLQKIKRKSALG